MEKDGPDGGDTFTFSGPGDIPDDLRRLLANPDFTAEDFNLQQFAIWTILENPQTSRHYVSLVFAPGGFGNPPSDEEMIRIARLLIGSGIDFGKYSAVWHLVEQGLFPRPAGVSVYCSKGGKAPVTVDRETPVALTWSWQAASAGTLDDYVEAAAFSLKVDGKPVDVTAAWGRRVDCEGGECYGWQLPPMYLEPGRHTAQMSVTLDRAVSDGFDSDGDGKQDVFGPGKSVFSPCNLVVE